VHPLFEQGWVGLILFSLLLAHAASALARGAWKGDAAPVVLLASLAGMLTVGVVDSLLDAPRLAALLVFVVLAGALGRQSASSRRHRRRRRTAPQESSA
jgi:hypothetical protein